MALQAGRWAAENILADIAGKPRKPFHYKDKGIMAMIGDNAAIAEVGAHHHELHGHDRLRRLAGRARLAAQRHPPARRRLRVLGVGLLRLEPGQLDHRRPGRRPHRLGRRRRRQHHLESNGVARMTLHGKVAIVTGGNSGIGKGIVLALAEAGANIVIDYVSHPEATEELEKQVVALGDRAIGVDADVSKVADLQRLIDTAVASFGRVDIMVNNAGIETRTSVLNTSEQQYDRVLDINLKSAFFGTQIAAKQMIKQGGGGRVINITSVHEDWPMPDNTPYCLSKGGMRMLTRTAGVELAPRACWSWASAPARSTRRSTPRPRPTRPSWRS